ncbi:MAG: hypothetical protein KDB57_06690 [Solirubrobacterales bacterium]|nr:hypothetical protein [Solirubrobacterales bacterium]
MWWTGVKILGVLSAVLLTLAFFFILVMVTRPALLAGVSADDLAHSLANTTSPGGGSNCRKADDGEWTCWFAGQSGNARYRLEVNWMGCWEASRTETLVGEAPESKSGCIELGDVIRIDSD